jgi:hypothetical protein
MPQLISAYFISPISIRSTPQHLPLKPHSRFDAHFALMT